MTDVNVDLAGRISGIESVEIEDVLLVRLDHFRDSRGQILKIWRDDSPIMADWKMGEIYVSTAYPGIVKAWHRHTRMTLRYVCVHGKAQIGLVDTRLRSATKGRTATIFLDAAQPAMLVIPPLLWNGFRSALEDDSCAILNLPDLAHDPAEIERAHPDGYLSPLRGYWGPYREAG